MKLLMILMSVLTTNALALDTQNDVYGGIHFEYSTDDNNQHSHPFVGGSGFAGNDYATLKYSWIAERDQFEEEYSFNINYLFVNRTVQLDDNSSLSTSIGRVHPELGYYNQWRGDPRYNEMIYAPMGIYREPMEKLATRADGIKFQWINYDQDEWLIEASVMLALPVLNPQKEIVQSHFGNPYYGKFDRSRSNIQEFSLHVMTPNHKHDLRYNLIRLYFDFDSAVPFLTDSMTDSQVHTLGYRYYATESVDVTAEYIQVTTLGTHEQVRALVPGMQYSWPRGWGLNVRYRPNERTTVYAGMDTWYLNPDDKDGSKIEAATMGMADGDRMFTKTKYFGIGHRLNESWCIKAQYIKGSGLASMKTDWTNKDWEVISAQLIHTF